MDRRAPWGLQWLYGDSLDNFHRTTGGPAKTSDMFGRGRIFICGCRPAETGAAEPADGAGATSPPYRAVGGAAEGYRPVDAMGAFQINDAEWEALYDEEASLLKMYLLNSAISTAEA